MKTSRQDRGVDPAVLALMGLPEELPEPTTKPCVECPWRRDAAQGHLGPYTAQEWVEVAHSDGPVACHMTIDYNGQDWSEMRQCQGMSQFRANVSKTPRWSQVDLAPTIDKTVVFGTNAEFIEHHT